MNLLWGLLLCYGIVASGNKKVFSFSKSRIFEMYNIFCVCPAPGSPGISSRKVLTITYCIVAGGKGMVINILKIRNLAIF